MYRQQLRCSNTRRPRSRPASPHLREARWRLSLLRPVSRLVIPDPTPQIGPDPKRQRVEHGSGRLPVVALDRHPVCCVPEAVGKSSPGWIPRAGAGTLNRYVRLGIAPEALSAHRDAGDEEASGGDDDCRKQRGRELGWIERSLDEEGAGSPGNRRPKLLSADEHQHGGAQLSASAATMTQEPRIFASPTARPTMRRAPPARGRVRVVERHRVFGFGATFLGSSAAWLITRQKE